MISFSCPNWRQNPKKNFGIVKWSGHPHLSIKVTTAINQTWDTRLSCEHMKVICIYRYEAVATVSFLSRANKKNNNSNRSYTPVFITRRGIALYVLFLHLNTDVKTYGIDVLHRLVSLDFWYFKFFIWISSVSIEWMRFICKYFIFSYPFLYFSANSHHTFVMYIVPPRECYFVLSIVIFDKYFFEKKKQTLCNEDFSVSKMIFRGVFSIN